MRQVSYAGGTFVTSDRIADALLEYAAALANAARASIVDVPVVGDGHIRMLIGPASQVMSQATEDASLEPDGTEFLDDIDRRVEQLRGWHR
jgi:hypothetical protein